MLEPIGQPVHRSLSAVWTHRVDSGGVESVAGPEKERTKASV